MSNSVGGSSVDPRAYEPTGTVEELKGLGLPIEVYRSCAPPSEDRKVAGCQFWNICEQPYKGLHQIDEDGRQVGGPHHHGVYIVAPSGAQLQDVRSCFQFIQLAPETIASGGVYEIVADEGEEILIKGTKQVPVNKSAPGGKQKSEPFTRGELVPYFKRPAEQFHDKVYEMKVRAAIQNREKNKRYERAVGYQQAAAEGASVTLKTNKTIKAEKKKEEGDPSKE